MLGDGKSVVLSFDDGPAPVSALESILEVLQEKEVKAEFYVLGSEVKQYPDAARMIVRQGDDIQNHSWSHEDLSSAREQDVRWELEQTQNIIEVTTGLTPTKVRPPYGAGGFPGNLDLELVEVARDLSLITHLGYRYRGLESAKGIGAGETERYRDSVYAAATQDFVQCTYARAAGDGQGSAVFYLTVERMGICYRGTVMHCRQKQDWPSGRVTGGVAVAAASGLS